MKKCIHCGAEVPEDAKFCLSCGKELTDEATAIKAVVKEAVEEGAKGLKVKIDEIEEKLKRYEELTKGIKAPYVSTGRHYGYDLSQQGKAIKRAIKGREHEFTAFSTDEGREQWAKFVIDVVKAGKALQEGTDSEGGYLVPEEFSSDIVQLARNSSYALQQCLIMPMTRDVMNIPTEASLGDASWVAEEAAITENNPSFGQVTLTAKKLANLATIANELLQDSAVDIVSLITEQFAYKIGMGLDDEVFNGDGTNFTGILTGVASGNVVTFASGETAFSNITADYLSQAIEQIEEGYAQGAGFYMGRLAMHYVRTLKDSNNAPIYANPGGQVPGTIYGYPRYVSEKMPNTSAANTRFVIFGNLRNYIIGRRLGSMTLDIDPYGKFANYQTRLRMVSRWGLSIANSSAFAVLATHAA